MDVSEGELVSLLALRLRQDHRVENWPGCTRPMAAPSRSGTPIRRSIPRAIFGMVFQQALLLMADILDNVLLPAEIVGLSDESRARRARELLDLVGLAL